MIGVVGPAGSKDVVCEFFELFKTPWEFWRPDADYDVVIHADATAPPPPAPLVIVYGAEATAFDRQHGRLPGRLRLAPTLRHGQQRIPIYGRCVTIPSSGGAAPVVLADTDEAVAQVFRDGACTRVRVGYELFHEVAYLLTTGQTPVNAAVPTLDAHIAFLRSCILDSGLPVVEIPPTPPGHPFVVCLTHDVDHPAIRLHWFDHTMLGFLHRAVVGSLVGLCTGRTRPAAVRRNLVAALTLPLVHLGLMKDFWGTFDRYLEIERGLGSTFFVIPVRRQPGRTVSGKAPWMRASSYGAADIAPKLSGIHAAGAEIGVHGIDAWIDAASGTDERSRVSCVTGTPADGVRMHWLYWDEGAPRRLEDAGFGYDSTFGYNETVGFRAGTLQAFRPIGARHLLEVPLTIMDTALFYPSRGNLAPEQAKSVVRALAECAEYHGGVLTINWHDRSLEPERLWGGFYEDLLQDLKRRAPWFATMSEAAAWFRLRRSARFEPVAHDPEATRVTLAADRAAGLPGLTLRVHRSRTSFTDRAVGGAVDAGRAVSAA